MTDTKELLAQYITDGSEAAFRELVSRYVDLVYSAAIRLVNGDPHSAEDITQTVFADLARLANGLKGGVMLGGWLHRHTCFVASNVLRKERRRVERERQAVEMNTNEDHSTANLASVAPVLDEAVNELSAEDRSAILLRFFEQKDYRSVGQALGSNEEAARKRVDRALEKLHGLLTTRGVTLSGASLATLLTAQATSAAPAGLALTVSSAALASAAAGAGTTLTAIKIMTMTKLKVGIVTAAVVAGVAIPYAIQHRANQKAADLSSSLQEQTELADKLGAENDQLNRLVAEQKAAIATNAQNNPSLELLRLRGEVARLRHEVAHERARTNGPSILSGIKADPGMWKVIRDQQKVGMTAIYKDFARKLELTPEQSEQLGDILADNIMENIDNVTAALRDNLTGEQMEPIFAGQEAALLEQIEALLGPEAREKYQEYTEQLASGISTQQFKAQLSGSTEEQEAKSRQIYELMQAEVQRSLASQGLPADYQVVPMLNFRNIASESQGEWSLALLDGIYQRVISQSGSFLSPEELEKFEAFRTQAINSSRAALKMNRTMMSPGGKN